MGEKGKEVAVKNHKLTDQSGDPIEYKKSRSIGGNLEPKYLVVHYTASRTTKGSVEWLTSRDSGASAHIVIGRDGELVQLVPFSRIAFHAGLSFWEGFDGMNAHSIGIEFVNAGRLKWDGVAWIDWVLNPVEESDMITALHKFDSKEYGWQTFPEEQIAQGVLVARSVVQKYDLVDVVGHDDISPRRKWDPGPAFPLESFRSKVMGRENDESVVLKTTGNLILRAELGAAAPEVTKEPLESGELVEVLDRDSDFTKVSLIGAHNGIDGLIGWLPSRRLQRVFNPLSSVDSKHA